MISFPYPDFENLGVEYLMAVCRDLGRDTDFVFYQAEDPYTGRKAGSPEARERRARRVAERIASRRPRVAAFSCVTDNYLSQLGCARALKALDPSVVTVFGGVHPTAVPERVLERPEVDCVAVGEAEESFCALLKAGFHGDSFALPDAPVAGMAFKKGGRRIGEFAPGPLADLDGLPPPLKEPLFPSLPEMANEYRTITSRGCPYGCSYCFNSDKRRRAPGTAVRRRSIDGVIAELVEAKARRRFTHVTFLDDCFTSDKEWIRDFCGRYAREVEVPFACISNPGHLQAGIAACLAGAGCVNVQLGVQSLSESLCRSVLRRRSDNAAIAGAIDSLKAAGIMVQADHMLGIPGDSLELQEEAVRFYNEHRPDVISIFWLAYYPRTAIVDAALERGLISKDDVERIESGERLTEESYLTGGSMAEPGPYYAVSFLLNWLPLLPKRLVSYLVESRLYRKLGIRNYLASTAFPRALQSLFNRRDFRGRSHILRFLGRAVWVCLLAAALTGCATNRARPDWVAQGSGAFSADGRRYFRGVGNAQESVPARPGQIVSIPPTVRAGPGPTPLRRPGARGTPPLRGGHPSWTQKAGPLGPRNLWVQ